MLLRLDTNMGWKNSSVLVTGGASFIGSHLVDKLLSLGARVDVADDFSSGRLSNLEYPLKKCGSRVWTWRNLTIKKGDLRDKRFAGSVMEDIDSVFHLAASHGGRGYIDSHPVECCTNMMLDQIVFEQSFKAGVKRACFASSACVYPSYLQREAESQYLLKEDDADLFVRDKALADLEYGWAKFMGEMTLKAYHRQYGMKTSSVRIFTAYGPRENETHAIIALIAKALIKMDPYSIWGTGKQDRNFTYVQDIVDAMILAAEKIDDGSVVNAGREDRIKIDEACEKVFQILDWRPKKITHDLTKPQGVASRAADLTRARSVLGWEPKVSYNDGFRKTIEYYAAHKSPEQIKKNLDRLLMER
jgi:UDP-glucose 4-epimerase